MSDIQKLGRPGKTELVGYAKFPCPKCGGTVDTGAFLSHDVIPSGGLRWQGVPCDGCPATYTVEVLPDG